MSGDTSRDARFWDKLARRYARSRIADQAGYERTLAATRRHLKPGDSVLEFGCGTGTTAVALAPSVSRFVGSDISGEMITIAREKAAAQGLSNVMFEQAAMTDAPWGDASFDAVLGFNVLHLIPDRAPVLATVRRVLKPGGLFITKTPCLAELNVMFRPLVAVMQWTGQAPSVVFFNTAQLEREIEAAGFTIIERERHASKGRDSRPFLVAQPAN